MAQLKITRTDTQIKIQSPYSPDLPKRARTISGTWNKSTSQWIFPIAAEEQVKKLYLDIYGEWDTILNDTVTLYCEADGGEYADRASLTLGNRIIATAYGRDSEARTAKGVIIIDGGFTSGGSIKNWDTRVIQSGVKFRLLDVPRLKAEQLIANPEWCSKIEIETPQDVSKQTNCDEREYNEQLIVKFREMANEINKMRGFTDTFVSSFAGTGILKIKLEEAEDAARFVTQEIDRINKDVKPEHYYAD